jgi:hypothetical protein
VENQRATAKVASSCVLTAGGCSLALADSPRGLRLSLGLSEDPPEPVLDTPAALHANRQRRRVQLGEAGHTPKVRAATVFGMEPSMRLDLSGPLSRKRLAFSSQAL